MLQNKIMQENKIELSFFYENEFDSFIFIIISCFILRKTDLLESKKTQRNADKTSELRIYGRT